jgi:hypothetical protein
MAIGTYAELVTAATEWLAREEDATLTARIPDFITLAEAKINRALLHPRMETRATLTVDTNDANPELLDLPTDFQTARSVRLPDVAGRPQLSFMAQSQMADYRYSIDNVSDQPIYFSIIGDQLELAPTPNQDYDVEIVYRANIPALTSLNTTNWLLSLAPDLYLYGTLLESAPYTKNDERLAVWASAVSTVIDQLNLHGARQSFDSGPSTIWLPGVTP